MKRITALLLVCILLFGLTACEKNKPAAGSGQESSESVESTDVSDSSSEENSSSEEEGSSEGSEASQPQESDKQTPSVSTDSAGPATFDRAWHDNPASTCFPVTGKMDEKADEMRSAIQNNTKSSAKITGTTYYVSNKGNDSNSGTSPSSAWATLDAVQAHTYRSGDAVLFERDGVFRGSIKLSDGVTYGAYGTGEKPCIYGSKKNYVSSDWEEVENNVWCLNGELFSGDVGNITFNHGEAVGFLCSTKSQLIQEYDFYCDTVAGNRVYLYLESDPKTYFKSIEIGYDCRIFDFDGKKDITIENLCFKYTGGHALRGSNTQNITIRYCEIGYVGGSLLNGYKDGTVRYGNGVELMASSKNTLVENNWIYQIYDSGITHQGDNCTVENFTARNNLVEYCGMGAIEYWHTSKSVMKNILYTGNMLRFAGYGFGGMQRPDKNMSACIQSNGTSNAMCLNKAENFVISNNVFELSTYQLVNATSSGKTPPKLTGNTYIQISGKWLGYYNNNNNVRFNAQAEAVIKGTWGDTAAKLEYL